MEFRTYLHYMYISKKKYVLSTLIYGNIAEYFSSNSSRISYFPVFPTLPKFGVFPRTVITGNYRWEFPPPVFTGQPCYLLFSLSSNLLKLVGWLVG